MALDDILGNSFITKSSQAFSSFRYKVDDFILKLIIKESPKEVLSRKLINIQELEHTVYRMIKRGKRFNQGKGGKPINGKTNIMTSLIYSNFGIKKNYLNSEEKEKFNNNIIEFNNPLLKWLMKKNQYTCENLFNKLYLDKSNQFFNEEIKNFIFKKYNKEPSFSSLIINGGKTLIEKVLGPGTYKAFVYAHEKHDQAEGKRAITNDYMVHPYRVALKAKKLTEKKDSIYRKIAVNVSLLHDVLESSNKLRRKNVNNLLDLINDKEEQSKKYFKNLVKTKKQIKNLPELEQIVKICDEPTAKLVKILSNSESKNYAEYIDDLFLQTEEFIKDEEMKDYFEIAPMVKLIDAIDNTSSLKGVSQNALVKRIYRNEILINKTEEFIKKYKLKLSADSKLPSLLKEFKEGNKKAKSLHYKEFGREHTEFIDSENDVILPTIKPGTRNYYTNLNLKNINTKFKLNILSSIREQITKRKEKIEKERLEEYNKIPFKWGNLKYYNNIKELTNKLNNNDTYRIHFEEILKKDEILDYAFIKMKEMSFEHSYKEKLNIIFEKCDNQKAKKLLVLDEIAYSIDQTIDMQNESMNSILERIENNLLLINNSYSYVNANKKNRDIRNNINSLLEKSIKLSKKYQKKLIDLADKENYSHQTIENKYSFLDGYNNFRIIKQNLEKTKKKLNSSLFRNMI